MTFRPPRLVSVNGILGWIPEMVKLSQNRFRTQIRLLGLSALVGIVAGLGAIVFYVATRVVEHYALGVVAGYYPEPRPGGEASLSWLPVAGTSILSLASAGDPGNRRSRQRRAGLHRLPPRPKGMARIP